MLLALAHVAAAAWTTCPGGPAINAAYLNAATVSVIVEPSFGVPGEPLTITVRGTLAGAAAASSNQTVVVDLYANNWGMHLGTARARRCPTTPAALFGGLKVECPPQPGAQLAYLRANPLSASTPTTTYGVQASLYAGTAAGAVGCIRFTLDVRDT